MVTQGRKPILPNPPDLRYVQMQLCHFNRVNESHLGSTEPRADVQVTARRWLVSPTYLA